MRVEELKLVGCRVVQRGDELRIIGDDDPALGKRLADVLLVQQFSRQAGVGFTRMTATRSAVKPGLQWVVLRVKSELQNE